MIDVDISVRRGSFTLRATFRSAAPIVALFGRSGSGKTTLVEAIAGLATPDSGRIVIDGRTLFDADAGIDLPPESRRVGYVFQEGLLFPHMSVRANLAYGDRASGEERARIVALLGLDSLMERRPGTLSGGEKQRVAIGRALLSRPAVLLMDEPLAALDGARKSEILRYIELLRDALRLPIVYVSHAIEEVTRLADHLVLVSEGRTLADGAVAELLGRPELRAHTGRFEAGAIVEATVARHDEAWGLTVLRFKGGELVVPNMDALPGEPVRARIRARDVALALQAPPQASFQNVLPGVVTSVGTEFGALVEVVVQVGATELRARITRKSAQELALAPGKPVFALLKAVSIDRHSVGFA